MNELSILESRLNRLIAAAPSSAEAVLRWVERIAPDVAEDAHQALGRGGRIRISVDVRGGAQVARVRVRLLRPDDDEEVNRNLFAWEPPGA